VIAKPKPPVTMKRRALALSQDTPSRWIGRVVLMMMLINFFFFYQNSSKHTKKKKKKNQKHTLHPGSRGAITQNNEKN
jgi:hypothetical protein